MSRWHSLLIWSLSQLMAITLTMAIAFFYDNDIIIKSNGSDHPESGDRNGDSIKRQCVMKRKFNRFNPITSIQLIIIVIIFGT